MMTQKVLIVDDDPGIQDIFKLIFERAGYQTFILASADAILEDNYQHPDIYILDKQLSGIDGCDLCRFLKKNQTTQSIPVIMVSASPEIEKLSKAAGADDFIEKPFRFRELLKRVENYIGKAVAV